MWLNALGLVCAGVFVSAAYLELKQSRKRAGGTKSSKRDKSQANHDDERATPKT